MRKLRIMYSNLSFGVRYALAYIWTAIMVLGIVLGAKIDNTYFWIDAGALMCVILILKDKIDGLLKTLLYMNVVCFVVEILTNSIDKWSVLAIEMLILIIGPKFFREHAN